jgi:hypothetical protein
MDAIHTETRHGLKIDIFQDDDCCNSPAEWDHSGGFIVFYHRNCTIEGPKDKNGAHIITKDDCIDYLIDNKKIYQAKDYYIMPLSALIHGGITLYLGTHDHPCDSGGWDSSFAGAVLVSKKEFKTVKKAQDYARGLVQDWSDYLSGNVYGYTIEDPETGAHVDSCWGFYGDYDKPGGALEEARGIIDSRTKNGKMDHNGQYLMAEVLK